MIDIKSMSLEQKVQILKDIAETENITIQAEFSFFVVDPDKINYASGSNEIFINEEDE